MNEFFGKDAEEVYTLLGSPLKQFDNLLDQIILEEPTIRAKLKSVIETHIPKPGLPYSEYKKHEEIIDHYRDLIYRAEDRK